MKKKVISFVLTLVFILPCIPMKYIFAAYNDVERELPFEDIPENAWYRESAEFCYTNEIIKGQGNEYTFAPNAPLTRATFTVMLVRGLDADISSYENKSSFIDCPVGAWYTESVEWAYDKGYVKGTSEDKFSPDIAISREEAAVILSRVLALKAENDSLSAYTDAEVVSIWAKDSVNSVLGAKLMGSTSTKKLVFSPKMTMTRAQASKILMSILKDHIHGKCEHSIKDADCKKGSYCEKCGLVLSLPVEHYSPEVSCITSGKCIYCGKEIPADASLHRYGESGCTEDKLCLLCGRLLEKAKGHDYHEASCIIPKYCLICRHTEGKPLGHDYTPASCTEGGKCTRCASTTQPLGHTCKEGICDRCGVEVELSEYEVISKKLWKDYNIDGYKEKIINSKGEEEYFRLRSVNDEILMSYWYEWQNGYSVSIYIYTTADSPVLYYTAYFDDNEYGSCAAELEGTLYANTMVYDIQFSAYHDKKVESLEWLIDNLGKCINTCLEFSDKKLKELYGSGNYIFGFEAEEVS